MALDPLYWCVVHFPKRSPSFLRLFQIRFVPTYFRNLNSFQLRSNKGEARYELIQIYFSRFLIFCIKPKTGSLCPTRTMSHRLPRRSTRLIDVLLQVPTNRALPSEIFPHSLAPYRHCSVLVDNNRTLMFNFNRYSDLRPVC